MFLFGTFTQHILQFCKESSGITCSPCFIPHLVSSFCFNTPCQYTPLPNLCPLIFGLTPFDWLYSVTLTHTYSIISYGNIIFDLHVLDFTLTFSAMQLGLKTKAWCISISK
jgi:hypothetical protein